MKRLLKFLRTTFVGGIWLEGNSYVVRGHRQFQDGVLS